MYCDSVEIKNLTFNQYLVDALSFFSYGQTLLHGRYWIHNNTFKRGYDSPANCDGDKSIIIREVHSVTISYNKFDDTGYTLLIGGCEYDYQPNITIHHNYYYDITQRAPMSRNANIHNCNNFYEKCERTISVRTSTYMFSEGNYFKNVDEPTYNASDESNGIIKSLGDIFYLCGEMYRIFPVKDRTEMITKVDYICSPDQQTDYSKFVTDPTLFYYDVENKCSDVEILHKAEDVPAFVEIYAGAGVLTKLELDN